MADHLCDWLDAAAWLRFQIRLGTGGEHDRERLQVVHGNLLMMCRAEFAADVAYERLTESDPASTIASSLSRLADAHAFLVSAHLAWATLAGLGRKLHRGARPYKAVHNALRAHRPAIARCKVARDHIEHVTDRLDSGRSIRFGAKMTAKVFRQAMGTVTEKTISFGNESFDLSEQIAALADTRKIVAPVIVAAATPQMRVTVGPVAR